MLKVIHEASLKTAVSADVIMLLHSPLIPISHLPFPSDPINADC